MRYPSAMRYLIIGWVFLLALAFILIRNPGRKWQARLASIENERLVKGDNH